MLFWWVKPWFNMADSRNRKEDRFIGCPHSQLVDKSVFVQLDLIQKEPGLKTVRSSWWQADSWKHLFPIRDPRLWQFCPLTPGPCFPWRPGCVPRSRADSQFTCQHTRRAFLRLVVLSGTLRKAQNSGWWVKLFMISFKAHFNSVVGNCQKEQVIYFFPSLPPPLLFLPSFHFFR